MKTRHSETLLAVVLVCALAFTTTNVRAADPLPSWNDGVAKQSIIDFVAKVTKEGSPEFVPLPERIAVYDNDGTLWSEQPVPVQFYFVADRVKALAPQHPEWRGKEPFASLLRGDVKAALEGAGLKPEVAGITMRPSTDTPLKGDDGARMQKLLDALEGLDDVQDVYTTAAIEE